VGGGLFVLAKGSGLGEVKRIHELAAAAEFRPEVGQLASQQGRFSRLASLRRTDADFPNRLGMGSA